MSDYRFLKAEREKQWHLDAMESGRQERLEAERIEREKPGGIPFWQLRGNPFPVVWSKDEEDD